MRTPHRFAVWVIGAGLALAVVLQAVERRPAAAMAQDGSAPRSLPALNLATVSGARLDTRALLGRVVVVNIWATWCGPCKAEIPALVALQQQLGSRVQVVGLAYDEAEPSVIAAFAKQFHINYPVAVIGPADADLFGRVDGIPMSFLVDRKGLIVRTYMGLLDAAVLERDVRALF